MRDSFDQFLAAAKAVQLTPEERADMRDSILLMENARASSQTVSLSEEERVEGRSALQSFVALHPTQKPAFSSVVFRGFFSMRMVSSLMVVVLFFGIGGGAAYAAEETVPGDILYPLKVDVTEPLRERFHWNPERRAEWSARRVERRMHEAEKLMKRGHRPPKSLEELQERMANHLAHMEERLSTIESEEKAERIRAHLEERMAKHEAILEKVKNGDLTKEDFKSFRREMHQKRERVRGMHKKRGMKFQRMHPRMKDAKKNGARDGF